MDIGERLRDLRTSLGKTQEQVAVSAGMNVTQYNAYERGRSRPASSTLERIALALGTSPLELVGRQSERSVVPAPAAEGSLSTLVDDFRSRVAGRLGLTPEQLVIRVELQLQGY